MFEPNGGFSRGAPGATLALGFFAFPLRVLLGASDVTGAQSAASNVMERSGVCSSAAESHGARMKRASPGPEASRRKTRHAIKSPWRPKSREVEKAAGCCAAEWSRDATGKRKPNRASYLTFLTFYRLATA
jgi:hypothetical protein